MNRTSKGTNNIHTPTKRVCKECGSSYMGVGNSKYCKRACSDRNTYTANMLKPEWRVKRLMSMAKNRAKNSGVKFDLTPEYLMSIWDGYCTVSGIELCLDRSGVGVVHPYAPSLDRIVPALGYTEGNVRWVCYQMNVAMSEFGLGQFEKFVDLYTKNKSRDALLNRNSI